MWIGPSIRSRFYSHQSRPLEEDDYVEDIEDVQSLASQQAYTPSQETYVSPGSGWNAPSWNCAPPPLPRRGGRGRGRTRREIASGRGGGSGRPLTTLTTMRMVNDNNECSYNAGAAGRSASTPYYDQNQGRGRGGLPNETAQNIRKSGYGYVGPTHAIPRDVYRRFGGVKMSNDAPVASNGDNYVPVNRASSSFNEESGRYQYRSAHPYGRTTQSKYRKKPAKKKAELEANEIRIRGTGGSIKQYVCYASSLLSAKENRAFPKTSTCSTDTDSETCSTKGKTYNLVKLTATGRAIGKAVNCVEVIKRKIYGLHQLTNLNTVILTEIWEPLESGLREVTISTSISAIEIILTFDRELIDCTAVGYQAPISWIDLGDAREYLSRIESQNDKMRAMKIKYDNQAFQISDMRNKYDVLAMQWKRNKLHMAVAYDAQNTKLDVQKAKLEDTTVAYDAQTIAYDAQTTAYGEQTTAYDVQTSAYDTQTARLDAQTAKYDKQTDDLDAQITAYDKKTTDYDVQTTAYDAQTIRYDAQTLAYDEQTIKFDAQTLAYDAQTAQLDAQTVKYDKQMDELDAQTIAYDAQTLAYDEQTIAFGQQRKDLDSERLKFTELKTEFDALKKKKKEKKQRRRLKYETWDAQNVTDFIIKMNAEKYSKYKENLLSGLSEQGIDGSCLTEISKEDLYRLGVRNFKDKRDIFNAILSFTGNASSSPPAAEAEEKEEK